MRIRLLAVGLLTGLIAGLGVTEAHAAGPAPTNVQVRWKDSSYRYVVISWSESQPQANRIELRAQASDRSYLLDTTTADEPDMVEIRAGYLSGSPPNSEGAPLEVVVRAGTEEGGPEGVSARFDTDSPLGVKHVSTSRAADGAITVHWRPTFRPDATPGDPLDRPVRNLVQVSYTSGGLGSGVPIGGPTAARQITYTLRSPHALYAIAQNEWGGYANSLLLSANRTELTVKVPAWVVYGATADVTGTVSAPFNQDRTVVLQARNSSAGPWYTVASDRSHDGRFTFVFGTGGSRQYRVVAPSVVYYGGREPGPGMGARIALAAETAPVSSTTQLQARGFFTHSSIGVGMTAYTGLNVYPAATTTALLQRWTGKTWVTDRKVTVRNGSGTTSMRTTQRGRTAYRYYVPAVTYGGRRFAAAYTPTFVNNVR